MDQKKIYSAYVMSIEPAEVLRTIDVVVKHNYSPEIVQRAHVLQEYAIRGDFSTHPQLRTLSFPFYPLEVPIVDDSDDEPPPLVACNDPEASKYLGAGYVGTDFSPNEPFDPFILFTYFYRKIISRFFILS